MLANSHGSAVGLRPVPCGSAPFFALLSYGRFGGGINAARVTRWYVEQLRDHVRSPE
jgi:hypothetical protein